MRKSNFYELWAALIAVFLFGCVAAGDAEDGKGKPAGGGETDFIDSDNDGMSDVWEIAYNLNPHSDDSQNDFDDDGKTNLEEFNDGLTLTIPGYEPIDASFDEADYTRIHNRKFYQGYMEIHAENNVILKDITIDAENATYGIRISGSNNVILSNITVHNAKQAAIHVRSSTNVKILNSRIYDSSQWGIQLSSVEGSENTLIANNEIYDTIGDAIFAGQGNQNHNNLIIYNNYIHDIAQQPTYSGLYHGMYIKSSGFRIENNRIINVKDGNGISIRSSGLVRNNTVDGTGKSGIRYYANAKRGVTNLLVIQDNYVRDVGRNLASKRYEIDIIGVPPKYADLAGWTVENFILRNNDISNPDQIDVDADTHFQKVRIE